jgi:hypothetical protein
MRCRIVPVPWSMFRPEQETPTLWRGSAPKLLSLLQAPRDHPPCGPPVPEGPPFRFRVLVPQTSCRGNEFGSLCAGFSRPGSGFARRSGRGVCGHRSRAQQPGHGRMAPRRWGVSESSGVVARDLGSRHGREAVRTPRRRKECPLTPKKRPGPPSTPGCHPPRTQTAPATAPPSHHRRPGGPGNGTGESRLAFIGALSRRPVSPGFPLTPAGPGHKMTEVNASANDQSPRYLLAGHLAEIRMVSPGFPQCDHGHLVPTPLMSVAPSRGDSRQTT